MRDPSKLRLPRMQRRDFLRNASLALAAFGLPALNVGAAGTRQVGLRRLGEAHPFDFASLKGQARALANAPYQTHKRTLPGPVEALDWDQYQSIRYRQDHALWGNEPGRFQAKFFHLGLYFHSPVRMFDVVDGKAQELAYDGAAYDRSPWTRSAYSVAQIWLWDERLFDHASQRFTIDRLLAETAHLGGFDGIVLWHAYPIIGIDDRNQFDFYRDVPGLRELIADFQARGIRIFVDYNPWDTGTRTADHNAELAALVRELDADGVFLDTMKEANPELIAALPVLEGESRVPNQRVEDHLLSWAQWFADSEAPGVMRARSLTAQNITASSPCWH